MVFLKSLMGSIADGTSYFSGGFGKLRGWKPYMTWNGDLPVDALTVELMANSAADRCCAHSR